LAIQAFDIVNIGGFLAGSAVYGLDGNDKLYGNYGTDYIFGGVGNDELDGAAGRNFLFGGENDDTYRVEFARKTLGGSNNYGGNGQQVIDERRSNSTEDQIYIVGRLGRYLGMFGYPNAAQISLSDLRFWEEQGSLLLEFKIDTGGSFPPPTHIEVTRQDEVSSRVEYLRIRLEDDDSGDTIADNDNTYSLLGLFERLQTAKANDPTALRFAVGPAKALGSDSSGREFLRPTMACDVNNKCEAILYFDPL